MNKIPFLAKLRELIDWKDAIFLMNIFEMYERIYNMDENKIDMIKNLQTDRAKNQGLMFRKSISFENFNWDYSFHQRAREGSHIVLILSLDGDSTKCNQNDLDMILNANGI